MSEFERFMDVVKQGWLSLPILKFCEKCGTDLEEFSQMLKSYLSDPTGFILCGDRPGAWKRNNVVSLYQLLKDTWPPKKVDGLQVTFYSSGTAFQQGDRLGHFDVSVDDLTVRVDPGPSAMQSALDLIRRTQGQAGVDPLWLQGILITHTHPDHSAGFPALFERMRWGGLIDCSEKFVIGNHTAIHGNPRFDCGPLLDKYKKRAVQVLPLAPGDEVTVQGMGVIATYAKHIEAIDGCDRLVDSCIGFRMETRYGSIGITGDTEWDPRLAEDFKDVDLMIAYVTQEAERSGSPTQKDYGLGTTDCHHRQFLGEVGLARLIREVRPSRGTIVTDFGDQLKTPDGEYATIPETMIQRLTEHLDYDKPVKAAAPGLVAKMDLQGLSFESW